jgi:hypothetical protein
MAEPNRPVCTMPAMRMRNRNPFHKLRQITILSRPKHKMPVIAHNAITAEAHLAPIRTLCQDLLEGFEISPFLEYPQPTVCTVKNVIDNITFRNPFKSRHNKKYTTKASSCL